MAEKLNPKEIVSFEEVLLSNVYTQEALILFFTPTKSNDS